MTSVPLPCFFEVVERKDDTTTLRVIDGPPNPIWLKDAPKEFIVGNVYEAFSHDGRVTIRLIRDSQEKSRP